MKTKMSRSTSTTLSGVEATAMRQQAKFWCTARNFLIWMRREFSKPAIDQQALDERIQARILPHVKTVGGSLYDPRETPLSVWRKALASQDFSH